MMISVIIPTYKPQKYLLECLEALNRQKISHIEFEVIIVLNGCNDPYFSILEIWLKDNALFCYKLLQIDVSGVSNARNIGLDEAVGEYVTFIDDDDYVSSDYLSELLSIASPTVVSLCYPLSFVDGTCDFVEYYVTKDYKRNPSHALLPLMNGKKFFSGPVYKLIHHSIIGNRRFNINYKNGEDSLFMFLISNKIKNISFTSTHAIYYRRIRNGSAANSKKSINYLIANYSKLIIEYSIIYLGNPLEYSLAFYITRILGSVRTLLCL